MIRALFLAGVLKAGTISDLWWRTWQVLQTTEFTNVAIVVHRSPLQIKWRQWCKSHIAVYHRNCEAALAQMGAFNSPPWSRVWGHGRDRDVMWKYVQKSEINWSYDVSQQIQELGSGNRPSAKTGLSEQGADTGGLFSGVPQVVWNGWKGVVQRLVFSKEFFSCATFKGERKLSGKMDPCTMTI